MSETHWMALPEDAGSSVSPNNPTTPAEPPGMSPDTAGFKPLDWFRRFFAANPFYLASVLLLLYGIHRVSSDTGFLRIEVQQLFFNFVAIQIYEVALVGLAILLARRLIWYDSTLLVFLDNFVIVVPFILVTQASLIEQGWVWGFCAAGVGLVMARVGSLKRFLCEFNLPWRMLSVGGALLAFNAVLPVIYRELQEERVAKTITWGPAYHMNELSWLVLLPLMIACANCLPAARASGPRWPERRWVPFALVGMWLLASGVHLYALSYVYTFQLRAALWAPAFVVLAWTLEHRVSDLIRSPAAALRITLLVLPLPLSCLALFSEDRGVVLALLSLNTVLYAWSALRGNSRVLAGQLALASGITALVCIPSTGVAPAMASASDHIDFLMALIGYVFTVSLLSRRPELGLLGAITTGVGLGLLAPCSFHYALEGALMFLLLHSLRWEAPVETAARALRWVAAALWATHAFVWAAAEGPGWQLAGIGAGALLTWMVVLWMTRVRPPVAVAAGAAAVTLCAPGVHAIGWVSAAPAGPLAVVGSFVLLGVGTVIALSKHRWDPISED